MNWTNNWDISILLLLSLIAVAYMTYLTRLWFLTRQLKREYVNILKKILIRATYILLIIISIMGPSFVGEQEQSQAAKGRNIWLCVDVSLSMNATDILPNRFEHSKQLAISIAQSLLPNDRLGLIFFADKAHVASPFTYDHEIIINILESISSSYLKNSTSNFNHVIDLLMSSSNQISNQNASMLVLSDGEFHGTIEQEKIKKLRNKIKFFVALIGTDKGGIIINNSKIKRDSKGAIVKSYANPEQLKFLVDYTGGQLRWVGHHKHSSKTIMTDLAQAEKSEQSLAKTNPKSNKYIYVLILSFVLILIDALSTAKIISL